MPGAQLLQMGDHQCRVKAVGMVIVQLAALLIGKLVMALIVAVVVDDADLIAAEMLPQLFGQGVVLPLPVPPAMPMMMVFISCCSLYIQFDLAPGGLVGPAHNAGHLEHAAAGTQAWGRGYLSER